MHRFILAGALSTCLLSGAPSFAQSFCQHLDVTSVGVAEGRVRLESDGSVTKYANAYHDSGAPLKLTQNYPIGWLDTNEDFTLTANAFIEDIDVDACGTYEVTLSVWTRTGTCTAGTFRGFDKYKVNTCALDASCDPDEECLFYGGQLLEYLVYESYGNIYYELEAGPSGGTMASDPACFNVGSSESACY